MANENQTPTAGQGVAPGQQQPAPAVQPQVPPQQAPAPTAAPVQPIPVQPAPVQPVQQVPVQPVMPQSQPLPAQPMAQPAAQPMAQAMLRPGQPYPQAQPLPAQQPMAQPMIRPGQPYPQGQPMPAQQMVRPGQPLPGQQPMPGQPRPAVPGTRKPPNPKRLIGGCLGCFGGAIVLFVIFVLIFVAQTSATGENPLAKSLGMDTGTFINTLILIVNLVFGALSVILFLLATVGVFRFFMARKDDKDSRKKGLTLAGISGLILLIGLVIWIGIYAFLDSRKVPVQTGIVTGQIITDPKNVLLQVAPLEIAFTAPQGVIDTKKYSILAYNWDFGDGEKSTDPNPKHTYKDMGKNAGQFTVNLSVSIQNIQTKEQTSSKFSTIVTFSKVLNASFKASPEKGPAPLAVSFDAGDSSVSEGQISAYDWDFDGTNTFKDASGVTASHTFNQVGTYKISLRVTDDDLKAKNYRIATKDIVVEGSNIPIAVLDIPTTDGKYYAGVQYSFNGDKSTSPTGKIVKYSWDFGDGSPKANTRTANHTYKATGEYTVVLDITDESGVQGEATQKIKVEKQASGPIAVIKTVPGPASATDDFVSGPVPLEVSFDASGTQNPDNNIVDYKWDFNGDGTFDASGEQVKYVYKEAGIFNATLLVVDANNNESRAVVVVKAGAQPLQARLTANPIEGVAPLTVTFDASGSSYPNGQIVSYEWDFGDGTPKRIDVAQVTYKYSKIGTFTAKVTAIASDNSKASVETPVNVRPVPLTACFSATPEQGAAPLTIEFDPRCSTGTVAKYNWDFGDNSTTRTRKPTHTFNNAGSYTVTLEVSDNQNVVNSFTKSILVTGNI